MNVAALGPEGTFSHELAKLLFPDPILLLPTIRSICSRVEEGTVLGLVPIENSEAGGVGPTLDALQREEIYIVGEAYLPVHHHLAAWEPLEHLEMIYAHPQTHEQCSDRLDALGCPIIHTSSNAASALAMREHPHSGAVVSKMIADLYQIPIILWEIQNSQHNITRFVLLRNTPLPAEEGEKCSIIIDPRIDRPGLLHALLDVFARHGINLTRIESRPSKRGMGSYIFFLDFEMTAGWVEAMQELKDLTRVKELGCYRRLEVPE